MPKWLKNITDKGFLQDNMTFVSLYIAVFENMTDYVISNLKSFLCDLSITDGKEVYKETAVYREEIKNRVVDDKGNKDTTKASFLWLVDNGAITQEDYGRFLEIKKIRNRYAHELTSVIYQGVCESEIKLFFDMFSLYQKTRKWFFINIEAVILGEELPEDVDLAEVHTGADIMFGMILDVLYNGKSEEYKSMIEAVNKEYDCEANFFRKDFLTSAYF